MKDFMTAALPWICVGIVLALAAAGYGRDKDGKNGSCMAEGMLIGMGISGMLSTEWMPVGMLLGMAAGMCIKKRSGEEKR